MNIVFPKQVGLILHILNEKGYSAFIVGGCVRDSLLGLEPHDWDITTDATPEQVIEIFKNYKGMKIIPTGIKFGTVTLLMFTGLHKKPFAYEITTFRTDSDVTDGRRPLEVTFGKDINEDLQRRDFTINAIAYSHHTLTDPYKGIDDLNNKIIRAVGNPIKRFGEDRLRVLRAVRFACKYDFTIEEDTLNAINSTCLDLLEVVSKERIHDELLKIFSYPNNKVLNSVKPLLEVIFNTKINFDIQIEQYKTFIKFDNIQAVYATIADTLYTLKIGNEEEWLRDFKFSNKEIKAILYYINIQSWLDKLTFKSVTDGTFDIERDIKLKECLRFNPYQYVENYLKFNDWNTKILEQLNKEPHSLNQLQVNGDDLLDIRIQDTQIGTILNSMVELVIREKDKNTKEYLLSYAKCLNTILSKGGENNA